MTWMYWGTCVWVRMEDGTCLEGKKKYLRQLKMKASSCQRHRQFQSPWREWVHIYLLLGSTLFSFRRTRYSPCAIPGIKKSSLTSLREVGLTSQLNFNFSKLWWRYIKYSIVMEIHIACYGSFCKLKIKYFDYYNIHVLFMCVFYIKK